MYTAVNEERATRAGTLRVLIFGAETDPARYARFQKIRVRVFGEELGWDLPRAAGRWYDPFDQGARLLVAETADRLPIGILRALTASTAFPHRDLFEQHLEESGLRGRESIIGTLNALAVLPEYRSQLYRARSEAQEGSASRLLLRAALRDLAADGVRIVLATVLGPASARAFLGVGFRLLDQPRCMPGQTGFHVANVGLVLTAAGDADAARLRAASAYFNACHEQVSALGPVEELFGLL